MVSVQNYISLRLTFYMYHNSIGRLKPSVDSIRRSASTRILTLKVFSNVSSQWVLAEIALSVDKVQSKRELLL